MALELGGEVLHRRRIVLRQIGDAESAAEVDDRDLRGLVDAELGDDVAQAGRSPGGRPARIPRRRRSASRCGCAGRPGADGRSANTRRTASIAAPLASDSPNFWSSCAVEMNSWVWASTPTVTRTSTSCTTPAAPAISSRRSISVIESEHDVADAGLDGRGQLVDGFVVAVQRDSLGREVGVQRDGELAAAARRRATGPPRRSSARPRCTGTPWRRSARARRRRTRRRCRGSATGSRPRR